VPQLDRSTIWPYRAGEPGDFYYQRYAHPTGVEAERVLGELEGGEALLFPSGSAAITTLVLSELAPGKTIALAEGAYYGTAVLFRSLERWGLRFVDSRRAEAPEAPSLLASSSALLRVPSASPRCVLLLGESSRHAKTSGRSRSVVRIATRVERPHALSLLCVRFARLLANLALQRPACSECRESFAGVRPQRMPRVWPRSR